MNIGAGGSAVGGRLNIGTDLGGATSLVIPAGVNALGDFSKMSGANFTLLGNLVNSGRCTVIRPILPLNPLRLMLPAF